MENRKIFESHSIFLCVPDLNKIDIEKWTSWYNDYTTTQYNSHGIYPISINQELDYLKNELNNPNTILLAIYTKVDNLLIGNISLTSIDLLNKKAELSITIGDTNHRKQSISIQAVGLMLEHAFTRLNLNRVYLGTHEALMDWITKLNVLGFIQEGILRDEFHRSGKYYNAIRAGVLAKDFFRLKHERNGKFLFENADMLLDSINDLKKVTI